jgi:hypothetical protein
MNWWGAILAVIAAALAYGYWEHRSESRRLAKLFARLARENEGRLKAANFLALPQLRFERKDRRYFISAMANSGATGPVRGPFTFVDLELPFGTCQKVRIVQSRGVDRVLDQVIECVTPGRNPTTGHREFDEAFLIEGDDQAFVSHLLGPGLRAKLLNSRLPRLELGVESRKIKVHIDGFATREADLVEMIDIADLLADRCPDGA